MFESDPYKKASTSSSNAPANVNACTTAQYPLTARILEVKVRQDLWMHNADDPHAAPLDDDISSPKRLEERRVCVWSGLPPYAHAHEGLDVGTF